MGGYCQKAHKAYAEICRNQHPVSEGLEQGEVAVILRLLKRRLGAIEPEIKEQIRALSMNRLEDLAEVL